MISNITILTPAETFDLTTLERAKLELGLATSDTSQDEFLTALIHDESEVFADLCKRTLAQERVEETFDVSMAPTAINLSRYPVTTMESVVIDGVTQDAATYDVLSRFGTLSRAPRTMLPLPWSGVQLVATYIAGYELLTTLPRSIERAVLTMVRARKYAASRDPAIRSENVIGVLSMSYGGSSGDVTEDSLPPDVKSAVNYYKDHRGIA